MAKDGNETNVADKADPEVDLDHDTDVDDDLDEDNEGGENAVTDEDVDDDVDDLAARLAPGITPQAHRQRQMRIFALVTILALGVVILAVLILQPSGPKAPKPPKVPATVTFIDAADHFRLSYPGTWTVLHSTDTSVKLLATFGANGLDLLQVRVVHLTVSVDSSNVNSIKSVTDAIVSGANVTMLEQKAVQVGNAQGYDYFYSFPSSGTTLVHSHFFVFPADEMIEIVVQTRRDEFASYASKITTVLSSFHTT